MLPAEIIKERRNISVYSKFGGNMMNTVRMGIVGLGNIGTDHANNITANKVPNMVLGAICDVSAERRAYAQSRWPDIPVFEHAEDLFKSGLVDAVVIAVPHYDHPKLAIEAFEHDLHVVVEKPAGVYTKQVIEMNEAAKKSGKVFSIMFCNRTNPVYQKLRNMIQDGQLGAIKDLARFVTLHDHDRDGLDHLMGSETLAAFQALATAADTLTLVGGTRIDNLAFFKSTKWTLHNYTPIS